LLAIDPTGKFVYVANGMSNDVSAYRLNAASGALTPVAGSPFAAGTTAVGVVVVQRR
jgi:6-phosphogluconolactonase (cycloisomerase 2 family)